MLAQRPWHLLGEKFTLLRDFSGGLSTVFPNTAAIEAGFSLIGWGKNETRSARSDFSFDGILHYMHYTAVLKHKTG
jgi:hypothetical protein